MQSALGARFTVLSCIGCGSMDLERSCVGSTEGLKQEFNPLDAQREVCEAFIRRQKSAGRIALSDLYDDGGISARRWSDLHSNACSPTFPITELAARVGVSRSYFTRVFRLSYLGSEITTAILQGRQPPELTANRLMLTGKLASAWAGQRRQLALDWSRQSRRYLPQTPQSNRHDGPDDGLVHDGSGTTRKPIGDFCAENDSKSAPKGSPGPKFPCASALTPWKPGQEFECRLETMKSVTD